MWCAVSFGPRMRLINRDIAVAYHGCSLPITCYHHRSSRVMPEHMWMCWQVLNDLQRWRDHTSQNSVVWNSICSWELNLETIPFPPLRMSVSFTVRSLIYAGLVCIPLAFVVTRIGSASVVSVCMCVLNHSPFCAGQFFTLGAHIH